MPENRRVRITFILFHVRVLLVLFYLLSTNLLSNGPNEEPRQRHDTALGHSPGGLDHHEVRVGDGRRPVLSHVGRHVRAHVPERVEGSHRELKKKTSKHRSNSSHGNIFDHCKHLLISPKKKQYIYVRSQLLLETCFTFFLPNILPVLTDY